MLELVITSVDGKWCSDFGTYTEIKQMKFLKGDMKTNCCYGN